MQVKCLLIILFLFNVASYSQGRQFSYIGKYTDEKNLKVIADSLNIPLLVTSDNKVYSIGSECITRLMDGDINDRDKEGDVGDRKKKGSKNDRNNDGADNDRNKNGSSDERNKGGDVGYRNKKGNKNNRNKGGDDNDRNKNGDDNDRDKSGDADSRNSDGAVSNGPRCSVAKNGKILLYTRQDINSKEANIYYKEKFFNNKYFKIIQL
ncbi:MAG: hypothetical protein ACHQEB_02915 [Chitinophagales bacterium]